MRVGVSSTETDPRRCSSGCWRARPWPAPTSPARSPRPSRTWSRPSVRHRFTRRRDRPRHQGVDAALPGRAGLRGARAARDASTADDVLAVGPGRRVLLQRSGRPGDRRRAGRGDARGALGGEAGVRHLLRQPDPGPGPRLRHLQAEVRPPRRQPAGAGPLDRAGRRSPATTTASRSTRRSTGPTTTAVRRVEVSHVDLNDGVVEGLRCLDVPAFSVQYHPEAAPGPHDAVDLFDRFAELMAGEVA